MALNLNSQPSTLNFPLSALLVDLLSAVRDLLHDNRVTETRIGGIKKAKSDLRFTNRAQTRFARVTESPQSQCALQS